MPDRQTAVVLPDHLRSVRRHQHPRQQPERGAVRHPAEARTALLAALKRDPGAVGLGSLLTEITKLNDVRKLGLPEGLLADCSGKLVAAWRARAITMSPRTSVDGGGCMDRPARLAKDRL
ncbi:hypothetical protein [Streptomyces odonnellii]|uniref:hypothetical protein n=1 Tax=Streptomyces odonnellii TaxID=1417980 RepID=UPI0007C6C8B2|nr:hypothetical protein [Streptomyces odonnellii]